jgi:alpha-glucosidase
MKKPLFVVAAILLACLVSAGCRTAGALQLQSPDGALSASVEMDVLGQPTYQVDWHGKTAIAPSKLGLKLADSPFSGKFEVVGCAKTHLDNTWKPPYGERAAVQDHYNQMTIELQDAKPPHCRLQLIFRAADAGLAFAYTLPKQPGLADRVTIEDEQSEFRFPADHSTWASYSAQGDYRQVSLRKLRPGCERPLVIRQATDAWLALGEARLVDYARMKFAPLGGEMPGVVSRLDGKVEAALPLTTPWRVIMAADSPRKLLEHNDIFLNLNDPCAIADTSWIKPGKVLREVTLTTAGGKACIDFAAKHNLQYILFDAGWYGPENNPKSDARGVHLDPARSQGPLDLQEVIRYGNEHQVGVILYVNYIALRQQLDEILPLYHSWGVKGVKYGFVGVGTQDHTAFVNAAIRKAAAHQLMINIHDEFRPTGYARTYPNLMTVEGIRGDEEKTRSNSQSLTHLFTRFLAGPADNTICYYDARVDRLSSHAYQLAKAVCFYSPWQHLYWYDRPAGSPAKAGGAGGAETGIGDEPELVFFDSVPTVWDETCVLQGEIGEFAVIARRSGEQWFVGCMNNDTARTISLPLAFLGKDAGFSILQPLAFLSPKTTYEALGFADDPEVKTRTHVKLQVSSVDATTVMSVPLPANGGAAFIISKKKK